MKKNQATYSGTRGRIRNSGVIGPNSLSSGSVERTKKRMKKKRLVSGRKIFIAVRPIRVHITTPSR